MTPVQEILVRMENGDRAEVMLHALQEGYRADFHYLPSSGPGFDPHAGPVCDTTQLAFDMMIGTVAGVAKVRNSKIEDIDSPCNAELITQQEQQRVLALRGIAGDVLVNGSR